MKIKKISISGKTSDSLIIWAYDENGDYVGEYDGYVPDCLPGDPDGDYINFVVDVETGQILNWTKPTQEAIKELLNINTKEE